jgi:hypothetical protein
MMTVYCQKPFDRGNNNPVTLGASFVAATTFDVQVITRQFSKKSSLVKSENILFLEILDE